jgi:hypothetical protein
MIEVIINSIFVHHVNEAILKEALFLLSTLLFRPNTLPLVHSACDGTGLQIVTNAIYQNMRHEDIRKVAMELISQLSGDEMIQKIVMELTDVASQAKTNLTSEAMIRIRSIAMTIGVLSMVPENLTNIASSGGISPMVILLHVMSQHTSQDPSHSEALTTLFASLEEIIAYGDSSGNNNNNNNNNNNSLVGLDVKAIIISCVTALNKHFKTPQIVMSSLRLLSALTSFTPYRLICLENDLLQALNTILRQYISHVDIFHPIVNIFLNISSSDDDIAIHLAKHNSTKMMMHAIRENLSIENMDAITSLVRILNRLSTLDEGADILKRQGCVSCLFDVFECYSSTAGGDVVDNTSVQNLCLLTIQILMNEKDIQDILTRLYERSTDAVLFSLTDTSLELLEKVSLDMKRLGLLMLCGPDVIEQIENTGGVQLIQNYLAGFSPAMNSAIPENSLVTRARDEFATCCIEALGRAALRNPDVEATIAAIPLIIQVAMNNPTPAVFATMKTLCASHESILAAIATNGGTAICLEICQTNNYEPEVMASAFNLLSALAVDQTGLEMIIESNATDLICSHITDSLMSSDPQTSDNSHNNSSGSNSSGSSSSNNNNSNTMSSLQSAINVLQSLSTHSNTTHDQHINTAILKALSEIIESLASWTRNEMTTPYPDLLASTIKVVMSLLQSPLANQYSNILITNGDIAKIDRVMYSHDDLYLKYPLPTHALADMLCLLINQSELSNQFVKDLGSQEYLLRTMNYHPSDMSLQVKLANAIGGLGMDAALSGLFSFIEQVDSLTVSYSSDIIPQISQYVQLIGNLMLINGALNPEIAEHLLNTLLTVTSCLLIPIDGGVQSERDEALYTTITCLGKLLAIEHTMKLSEMNLFRVIEFIQTTLRDCDTVSFLQPETKVILFRTIRKLLDLYQMKALESCLTMNLFYTIQQMTPGTVLLVGTVNRRGGGGGSGGGASDVTNAGKVTAQSFVMEQNQTIDLLLKKLIDSLSLLEAVLPYRGVFEMCDMITSQNTQNPGDINWKTFLEKLTQQYGSGYLLDMLSEFRTPLSPHTSTAATATAAGSTSTSSGLRSANIVNNLVKAIGERITSGIVNNEIVSFDQQHHLDAIISTALFLLPLTSLHFMDCLANTPAGAYGILQTMPLIQSLIASMKSSTTSLHASTIIVKIASHEIDGTMKLLIDNGLIKQLLSSLKSTQSDESYIQNAVYLLRVFADSMEGGISQLHLPKDTIKLLSDLILQYGHNEYLTSVAGSISSDLSNAFAIGPEAQLEAQLTLFMSYLSGGGWQRLLSEDENKTPYYYHSTSGVSQWEEPAEYQTQLRVLDDILDLTMKLDQNLSDVVIGVECNDMIYAMLYNNCTDQSVTNKLMKFVYAQVSPTSTSSCPPLSFHLPSVDCKE